MYKLKYAIAALLGYGIGFFTLTGHVQEVVPFQGALNEIVFCIFSLMIGIGFTISFFSKDPKNHSTILDRKK